MQASPYTNPFICLHKCGQEASSERGNIVHAKLTFDSGPLRCSDEQEYLS